MMKHSTWGMMDNWSSFAMPFIQVLLVVALALSIVALWKYITHKH